MGKGREDVERTNRSQKHRREPGSPAYDVCVWTTERSVAREEMEEWNGIKAPSLEKVPSLIEEPEVT